MRNTRLFGLIMLVCMWCGAVCANAEPDPNYHIYICFGQSNMEGNATVPDNEKVGIDERFRMFYTADNCSQCGRKKFGEYTAVPPLARCFHWNNGGFGPVDYFGRTLVAKLDPSIKVGVVVVACGGTSIEMFQKTKYQSYLSTCADWLKGYANSYGGNPYGRMIETAKEAMKVGVIKGILLHQGESNTNNPNWPNDVKGVYEDILSDLGLKSEDVPLLAGEVRYTGPCSSHNNQVRRLPSVIPNSYVISAEGCEAANDEYHFTVAGYTLLGKRYAEKMLEILENTGANNPQKGVSVEAFINKEAEPGEIEIFVNSDNEEITRIDLYADGEKIENASGSFSYIWEGVSSGSHTIWAVGYDRNNKEYTTQKKEVGIFVAQTPYNGTPAKIPGKIEAEEFDYGGEGNAYHDKDEENRNGGDRNEGVDMSNTAIGYSQVGEWIEYTVDIEKEGEYIVESRVASGADGSAFTLYLDNNFIIPGEDGTPGGFVKVPNTGDWDTYTTVETKLNSLPKGEHVLKVEITGDWVDLDYLVFKYNGDDEVDAGIKDVEVVCGVMEDGVYSAYDGVGRYVKEVSVKDGAVVERLGKGCYVLRNRAGKSYTVMINK